MSDDIELIAAALAHEIKNPLTLVKANIDLLEAHNHQTEYKKNYATIKEELDKINQLMMEFINLTKPIGDDNSDLIYIEDILRQIVRKYTISLGDNIKISFYDDNGDNIVLGDEKSLSILFDNIIKNAVESTEYDGVINIYLEKSNGFCQIKIVDNGKGIKKGLESRIFEEFFTTKIGGNGLGLWICKKIVKNHGGTFEIYNNEDKGCSVVVKLPLAS